MYYLIKISYDGSKFYGFQRLNGHVSVQKVLEEALTKINKKEVVVKGAGRTDRGVHAYNQGVSFKLDVNIDMEGLKDALNSLIGPYIYVNYIQEVDENFHARFSTVSKKYVYKINLGKYNVHSVDYVYQCPYKLNIDLIKKVGDLYLGIHDFKNFVSGSRDNYEAIIYDINYKESNDILEITFHGKSFYRYMVT
jgi:tRNA pseudouridine38-40 synthase